MFLRVIFASLLAFHGALCEGGKNNEVFALVRLNLQATVK